MSPTLLFLTGVAFAILGILELWIEHRFTARSQSPFPEWVLNRGWAADHQRMSMAFGAGLAFIVGGPVLCIIALYRLVV